MTATDLLRKWPDYAEANPFNDAQSELQTVNKIRHFLNFASASPKPEQLAQNAKAKELIEGFMDTYFGHDNGEVTTLLNQVLEMI